MGRGTAIGWTHESDKKLILNKGRKEIKEMRNMVEITVVT
jgi:hypothetical protein